MSRSLGLPVPCARSSRPRREILMTKPRECSGIISDVKFKTFGCGSAIASSSYMTERVKGLSLEEAGQIKNTEIAKELSLPPVKLHCSSEWNL
jgi:NifU-like protein involved in Fe-S cluster formation